jgi:hypothetical protein
VSAELEGVLPGAFRSPDAGVAQPDGFLRKVGLVSQGKVQGCVQSYANFHVYNYSSAIISKWASVGWQAVPLMGTISWGQAEKAMIQSISARSTT